MAENDFLLHEPGRGARLDRATWTDDELSVAIRRLLAVAPMRARLAQAAARKAPRPGNEVAAEAILACLALQPATAQQMQPTA